MRIALPDLSSSAFTIFEGVGRPGLEPGTNPESFRGCSHWCDFSVEFNAEIASWGFFLRLSWRSSARASVIEGSCFAATSTISAPKRRVV